MKKEMKINIGFLVLIFGSIFALYVYNDFLCAGANCYELETSIIEPMFYGLLGLIPSVASFLLFPERIFISWLKHIVWWFVPIVGWMVASNEHESSFSPAANDIVLVTWSMSILFIITLIYALVMNQRCKKLV